MRTVTAGYQAEEARLRGAKPRVKAVLGPFPLDFGLAAGSGTYEHTQFGGEPGKLMLEAGFWEYAAWTSPVQRVPQPGITEAAASWREQVPYMQVTVFLRSAATAEAVPQAAFVPLAPGRAVSLEPFYQLRVEFTGSTWAGEPPGYVEGLTLAGRVPLPEAEILRPGVLRVELARDFSQLRASEHSLRLDNRRGQWLTGSLASPGVLTAERYLELYHGWELSDGQVEWLLVFRGTIRELAGLGHAWRGPHVAELVSEDWVAAQLNRRIGIPGPDGERRPFLRGAYRARAELVETLPPRLGEVAKQGSGSARLRVLGTYRGQTDTTFLLEAETAEEVGSATFRWSVNQGQSWREKGLVAAGAEDPVELSDGLAVYFESGTGPDFQAGDRFLFTALAPRHHYRVFGGPFEAITAVYLNGEETWEGISVDAARGLIVLVGRSALVEARVVKDHTTHPVDILTDILTEVGLGGCLDQDSFLLAKSLTPEYAIGVCFENVPASLALREILKRTLYDLWVDFGEIRIRAYRGEE